MVHRKPDTGEKIFRVLPRQVDQTVAAALREWLPGRSWSEVRRLLKVRQVTINGNLCLDAGRRLRITDVVKLQRRATRTSTPPSSRTRTSITSAASHDLKVRTGARLAVHELDARVLSCFDERMVIASKDVEVFLAPRRRADAERAQMLALYLRSQDWFKPVDVDRALRDGDLVGNGHRVIHTPGHCPGQICLQVGDVLLTSDHVLARITPHQFPQAITPFGGLEHYFHSLAKVRQAQPVNLALGGHEEPIGTSARAVDGIASLPPRAPARRSARCAGAAHHRRGRRGALRPARGLRHDPRARRGRRARRVPSPAR